MNVLTACTKCDGLLPANEKACPHCGWKPSKKWRTAALAAAALGLSSCGGGTVMPLYGVACTPQSCPCEATLPDGGTTKNDPAAKSRCADGGM